MAESLQQSVGSLQAQLQSLSRCSVDHMTVYRDTATHTRESIAASVAVGRSFIEKCGQLDERMLQVEHIAAQLGDVERALTALEVAFDGGGLPSTPRSTPTKNR